LLHRGGSGSPLPSIGGARGAKMRRAAILLTTMLAALVLLSGVALADVFQDADDPESITGKEVYERPLQKVATITSMAWAATTTSMAKVRQIP
jgi:hypothetical protein